MASPLTAEERVLLIDTVRKLFSESWPVDGGVERSCVLAEIDCLRVAVHEAGLTQLGACEGPGLADATAILAELGRAAAPAPLIGAVVANLTLDGRDHQIVTDFVSQVQAGRAVPAVALASFDGDREAGSAHYSDGKLAADLQFVEDAPAATHVIVLTDEPTGLAIVEVAAPGVTVTAQPGLAVPSLSSVEIAAQPATWIAAPRAELADVAQAVRILAAARGLGAAERAFELALEHAKVRRQFGHVIGEFQAIQHKLVDCLTRLDGARLLLSSAAESFDRGEKSWRVLADAALAFCGPALRQVALEAHHTLGAIGYAEEHEAPRHFRRVHADLVRFGGSARARAELAEFLLQAAA